MNFIPWELYPAFYKHLVFFFWTKDHDNSHGKVDYPAPPTSHDQGQEKNICSEPYCQLQRTNRKPGPLSGVNASYSLNLSNDH